MDSGPKERISLLSEWKPAVLAFHPESVPSLHRGVRCSCNARPMETRV
jgi:hypothetical protein